MLQFVTSNLVYRHLIYRQVIGSSPPRKWFWCRVRDFHPRPPRSERGASGSWANAAKNWDCLACTSDVFDMANRANEI